MAHREFWAQPVPSPQLTPSPQTNPHSGNHPLDNRPMHLRQIRRISEQTCPREDLSWWIIFRRIIGEGGAVALPGFSPGGHDKHVHKSRHTPQECIHKEIWQNLHTWLPIKCHGHFNAKRRLSPSKRSITRLASICCTISLSTLQNNSFSSLSCPQLVRSLFLINNQC